MDHCAGVGWCETHKVVNLYLRRAAGPETKSFHIIFRPGMVVVLNYIFLIFIWVLWQCGLCRSMYLVLP